MKEKKTKSFIDTKEKKYIYVGILLSKLGSRR